MLCDSLYSSLPTDSSLYDSPLGWSLSHFILLSKIRWGFKWYIYTVPTCFSTILPIFIVIIPFVGIYIWPATLCRYDTSPYRGFIPNSFSFSLLLCCIFLKVILQFMWLSHFSTYTIYLLFISHRGRLSFLLMPINLAFLMNLWRCCWWSRHNYDKSCHPQISTRRRQQGVTLVYV